ncbi:MAG: class I SAM-dependent methyltransferase [Pyrinomonadaceae bacterium]
MSTKKTDKELAFLYDLYVATDWGERFAELFDEHVKLPAKGRALYVASGTGGHALALVERAGPDVTFICVDESEERLDLARAKALAVKATNIEFMHAQLEALLFEDEQFNLIVADASMVAPERLPEMISEIARVAAPGAVVALNAVTSSSFGEFFSVYWEALSNKGHDEQAAGVESLIAELPIVSELETLAGREALDGVEAWTQMEEFVFASADEFLNAPLVRDFLLVNWLESIPDEEARAEVLGEIERIIDDERSGADFSLSIKATTLVGRKAK